MDNTAQCIFFFKNMAKILVLSYVAELRAELFYLIGVRVYM